jgi:hypothetical protein
VVGAQPLLEGLGVIVRSLNEGFSSLVVGHGLLGWVDWLCVSSALSMRESWDGSHSLWYDLPEAGWTSRPVIREMRRASGIRSSTAWSKGVLV